MERKAISKRVRFEVFKRDAFVCWNRVREGANGSQR